VKAFVDLKLIAQARQKFAVDVMYGADAHPLDIFNELGVPHIEIHGKHRSALRSINPEPILPHLAGLQQLWPPIIATRTGHRWRCDRIGAVSEDGAFVDAHKCYAFFWSGF